ncbi:DMT family transporter [Amycolatopsis pigmentata]|uniref:DMT family transporter n=1 Tax=Amycolatopsis pigmentata TaxID=450801 RepID=A0ABW5FWA1_9PSEU
MGQNEKTPVDRRALVAATITAVLWASAFVAIRSADAHFSPGALALGRLLAGSVTLVVILLIRREGLPARAAWPGIVVSGILWFGGYMVALNWGEQLVDAGTAAMLVNVGPILVALLGGWLLREGFPPRLMTGLMVSFAGAVVVGLVTAQGGRASLGGMVLCLVAAITYAGGVVGQKWSLGQAGGGASALQVTTFGCLIGMVACLPFSGQLVAQVASASLADTLNVVYLGVFPTAIAFTTWAYALSRTTAGRMGATTYVVPALVVLLSWLILAEIPRPLAFAGGALCLAGVAVSRSVRTLPRRSARLVTVEPQRTHAGE